MIKPRVRYESKLLWSFDKTDKVWKSCNQERERKRERKKKREGINFRSSVNNAGPMTRTDVSWFRAWIQDELCRIFAVQICRDEFLGWESIAFWFSANVHTLLSISVKLVVRCKFWSILFWELIRLVSSSCLFSKLIEAWKIFIYIFLLIVIEKRM